MTKRSIATTLALVCLAPLPAAATPSRCFDFHSKIVAPLKAPLPLPTKGDGVDSGEKGEGIVWARVRGTVGKSPAKVLALLLDHETFRDPDVAELEVRRHQTESWLARHRVHSVVKPFPLVKIEWTEEWGYAVAEGSAEDPATVVVSYEKVEGTSHISHFCGTVVLKRVDATTTDVYQYEESKITGKNEKDQVKSLTDLLQKLRAIP